MKRILYVISIFVVIAFLLVGCNVGKYKMERTITREYTVNSSSVSLDVSTFNGDIKVDSHSGDTIYLEARLGARGDDKGALRNFLHNDIDIIIKGTDNIVIKALKPSVLPRLVFGAATEFTLKIPEDKIRFLSLSSSNGDMDISDFNGELRTRTSNGQIDLLGITGQMDLETSNGKITGYDVSGGLVAETSNGAIYIDTVNGLEEADLHTSNGRIYLRCNPTGDDYNLDTSNGDISLVVPWESDLTIDVGNLDTDDIFSEFDNPSSSGIITIGAGTNTVYLNTYNGQVEIRGY